MLAGPSPEALIGPIAAATERIRVGSGGVMLPHYSPLKVAETFSLLAGLFPGRIDLGLGRAAGHRPDDDATRSSATAARPRRTTSPSSSPSCSPTSRTTLPRDHPFARARPALPGLPETPEPWLLGSSPQSAIWAGRARPSLRVRRLHQPATAPRSPTATSARFDPGARLAAPRTAVARLGARAETEEEAGRLAAAAGWR